MKKIKFPRGKMCAKHKHKRVGLLEIEAEVARRQKLGMKQKQCPECLYWFWNDEM